MIRQCAELQSKDTGNETLDNEVTGHWLVADSGRSKILVSCEMGMGFVGNGVWGKYEVMNVYYQDLKDDMPFFSWHDGAFTQSPGDQISSKIKSLGSN